MTKIEEIDKESERTKGGSVEERIDDEKTDR
jgi:hypothetical protein